VADDFARLVSLACHDLRTPLATVQGFAKTLQRLTDLEPEKQERYLGLIDASSDELVELLDLLSLAARIEGGRWEPLVQDADSADVAPAGATGAGAPVRVEVEATQRALVALASAAARHGGVEARIAVDGVEIAIEPVTAAAAPVVLGDELKDFGAAVGVRALRAQGAEVALDGERLTVRLPA
jgi:signal transduction histidine kinase